MIDKIAKQKLNVFLLVDCSTSMRGTRIEQVNKAITDVKKYLTELQDENTNVDFYISVITFSTAAYWKNNQKETNVKDFDFTPINAGGWSNLHLPKIFRNSSTITLVLSGIVVGSFMNAMIGLIKYVADKNNKLSAITFWMLGSLSGVTYQKIFSILPIIVVSVVVLFIMRWRVNIIALGEGQAKSLGVNYKLNRFFIVVCATLLTAATVSISGNIGWVGLVIPHISRAIIGADNRKSMPIAMLAGGIFLMVVDIIARNIVVDEIPLSIITGILGTIIYTIVLIKRGRYVHE